MNDPVTDDAANLKIYVGYALNLVDLVPPVLEALLAPLEVFIQRAPYFTNQSAVNDLLTFVGSEVKAIITKVAGQSILYGLHTSFVDAQLFSLLS